MKEKENAGLGSALYKLTEQILTCLGCQECWECAMGGHRPPGTYLWSEGQREMEIHPSALLTMARMSLKTYLCARLFRLDAPARPGQTSECVLKNGCGYGFLLCFLMDQSFGLSINSDTLHEVLKGIVHVVITQNLFLFENVACVYSESLCVSFTHLKNSDNCTPSYISFYIGVHLKFQLSVEFCPSHAAYSSIFFFT